MLRLCLTASKDSALQRQGSSFAAELHDHTTMVFLKQSSHMGVPWPEGRCRYLHGTCLNRAALLGVGRLGAARLRPAENYFVSPAGRRKDGARRKSSIMSSPIQSTRLSPA